MREISELIEEILWDRRLVEVPEHINADYDYLLIKDAKLDDRNNHNAGRKILLKRAIREGNPTEESALEDAISGGAWSDEDEKLYSTLEDHISFLETEKNRHNLKSRKSSIQKKIDEARDKLNSLSNLRFQFVRISAEYFSHESSVASLAYRLTRLPNGESPWSSEKDFDEFRKENPLFFSFLAAEIVNCGALKTEDYRRIARSGEWRILWASQKNSLDGLFGRPACDLTIRQSLLVYWSRVYDQVFEDPDRPDEDVINDDDKLDDWFANKNSERLERSTETKHKTSKDHHERIQLLDGEYEDNCTCGALKEKKKGLGMSRRHDDNCNWGVWRPYTEEEKKELADRFYGRNNNRIRSVINKEMETVADSELIEEQALREKKARMILGSKSTVTVKKQ